MKKVGIIKFYNGNYGLIKSEIGYVDFEKKDISFQRKLEVGDVVEFRVEEKFPDIKIARNILLVDSLVEHF